MLGERWGCLPRRLAAVLSPQQRAGRMWEPLCLFPHPSHFLLISAPCMGWKRNSVHSGVPSAQRSCVQWNTVFPGLRNQFMVSYEFRFVLSTFPLHQS